MNILSNIQNDPSFALFASLAVVAAAIAGIWGVYFLLTLPMRRAERARLFLDLVATILNEGRPLEETLMAISRTHDDSVGLRFHAFAAWLEEGNTFTEALEKVPRLLPSPVAAMLKAGKETGDLRRALPACRQWLADAVSRTQGAMPYLFMISMATAPLATFIAIFVLPSFRGMSMGVDMGSPSTLASRFDVLPLLLAIQWTLVGFLAVADLIYAGGPRVTRWIPFYDHLQCLKPWSRKRLQRDFSTMLGILLDSGVSEPQAVMLAADSVANKVFRARAERVIARLAAGEPLPQAVAAMDDTGEFRWRLRNAFHGRRNFLRALAGWNAALDAKAYQQEQAASQVVTTALILWNGVFVASIVVAVFGFLISVIDEGVLW